jgi:AcrR family transcriptional regulator
LFSQFGLKKATIDDMVRRARISKATIYRYYRGKQEIFDDVVACEADKLMSAIIHAVDGESTVVGKLRAYLLTKLSQIKRSVNLLNVTRETRNEHWSHGTEIQDQILNRQKSVVAGILEYGCST